MRHSLTFFVIAMLLSIKANGTDPAVITGTITDLDTGSPVAGATVAFGSTATNVTTTLTNADGSYSLTVGMSGAPSRMGYIEAAGPDHAPRRLGGEPAFDCFFTCGSGNAGRIELDAGEVLANQDLALSQGGRLGGAVSAVGGGPVDNVWIGPIPREYSQLSLSYSTHFYGVSENDGSWALPLALRPGTDFTLRAETPGKNFVTTAWNNRPCQFRSCNAASTDPVNIIAGEIGTGFDFALQPGATLSGTLLPDDVIRLVVFFDAAGIQLGSMLLPEGQADWQISQLSGGSHYLQFGTLTGASNLIRQLHNGLPCPFAGCQRARGAPITVAAGGNRGGIDIVLSEGGTISGSIIDDTTGLAPDLLINASNPTFLGNVNIIDTDGEVVGGGPVRIIDDEVVIPTSAAVAPGTYFVRTHDSWLGAGLSYKAAQTNLSSLDGYSDAMFPDVACTGLSCNTSLASPVTIVQGETTDITIAMSKGSSISGSIVDDLSGEGIAQAVVELVDAANHRLAATRTDNNGNFTFGAFPAGTYYLRSAMSAVLGFGTNPNQHPYFDRVFGAGGSCSEQLCDPTTGDSLVLDGSMDAGPFELRVEAGPVIRGRVIDSLSGQQIDNGRVDVFTADGTLVGRYRIDRLTGLYQTTALPPGTYLLVPVVSPAFVAAPLSADPERTLTAAPLTRAIPSGAFAVEMGTVDVETVLGVVDRARTIIFEDRFE